MFPGIDPFWRDLIESKDGPVMARAEVALKQCDQLLTAYAADESKRDWSRQLAELEELLIEVDRLLVLESVARWVWGVDWWCPGRAGEL